jgi:protein-disulfide isomerase
MNEQRRRNGTSMIESTDEQILAGVRRHMSDVESQVPLPPLWQPKRGRSMEASNPVRTHIRPAFGLGGLAVVAVLALGAAVLLGPWRAAGPQGGLPTGSNVTITFIAQGGPPTQEDLQRVADIIRQRAVAAGVADVTTTIEGLDEVRVELPGLAEAEAENMAILLGTTGKLEFVLLPRDVYGYWDNTQGYVPGTVSAAAPPPSEGDFIDATLPVQFTGDQLDRTQISAGDPTQFGEWVVRFAFKEPAADEFGTWSGKHVNDYFAIVLDGRVVSAPYIKSAITGGQGQISGSFTAQSARDLATILKYGSLPFPLDLVSIETTGQTPNATGPIPFGSPIAPAVTTPTDIPSSERTLGDPKAPVTVDVWGDFRCAICFDFAVFRQPQLVDDYVRPGKVKLVYHDLIVIDGNQQGVTESRDAAAAAMCAADQGEFWTYSDWLWANQSPSESPGAFTIDRLIEIGRQAGLEPKVDMTIFEACVRDGNHTADVEAWQQAIPSGATGAPTVLVNGQLLSSGLPSYADLKAAIDAALAGASPIASPSAGLSVVPSAASSVVWFEPLAP